MKDSVDDMMARYEERQRAKDAKRDEEAARIRREEEAGLRIPAPQEGQGLRIPRAERRRRMRAEAQKPSPGYL